FDPVVAREPAAERPAEARPRELPRRGLELAEAFTDRLQLLLAEQRLARGERLGREQRVPEQRCEVVRDRDLDAVALAALLFGEALARRRPRAVARGAAARQFRAVPLRLIDAGHARAHPDGRARWAAHPAPGRVLRLLDRHRGC